VSDILRTKSILFEVKYESIAGTQEKSQNKKSVFSRRPNGYAGVSLVVVVALIGGGAYTYVKAQQAKAATSTASTLQTATARTGNLILEASGSGYLVAASEANVAFEIDGKSGGTGCQAG